MARDAAAPQTTFILPPDLAAQLAAHARIVGDDPVNVLADALMLHFDALHGESEPPPRIVGLDDELFAGDAVLS